MKVKGAPLGPWSWSTAVTYTVFLLEHRLLWLLIRVGQWSLESATLMAMVPVAVLVGMSLKGVTVGYKNHSDTSQIYIFVLMICASLFDN